MPYKDCVRDGANARRGHPGLSCGRPRTATEAVYPVPSNRLKVPTPWHNPDGPGRRRRASSWVGQHRAFSEEQLEPRRSHVGQPLRAHGSCPISGGPGLRGGSARPDQHRRICLVWDPGPRAYSAAKAFSVCRKITTSDAPATGCRGCHWSHATEAAFRWADLGVLRPSARQKERLPGPRSIDLTHRAIPALALFPSLVPISQAPPPLQWAARSRDEALHGRPIRRRRYKATLAALPAPLPVVAKEGPARNITLSCPFIIYLLAQPVVESTAPDCLASRCWPHPSPASPPLFRPERPSRSSECKSGHGFSIGRALSLQTPVPLRSVWPLMLYAADVDTSKRPLEPTEHEARDCRRRRRRLGARPAFGPSVGPFS